MNGNTSYTVMDAVTGAQQLITFERPESLRIGVRVTLVETPTTPSDIEALIKAAVVASATGADDSVRIGIGDTTYASRFYCVVIRVGVSDLVSIEVAVMPADGDPVWGPSVSSEIDQLPTISADDVSVIVRERQA